jgi:spore coat protein CotH
MTGINVIFEGPPRQVLSEALAYDLFRKAGVPTPHSEHVRLSVDGRPAGYHLLVEQPNKAFLRRHGRDEEGNLYKLLWYGRGMVEQHEKKINAHTGHDDLVQLIEGLRNTSPSRQWEFIQQNFRVEEMTSYYAVNMCIQNWDGFFNNYFAYHTPGPDGRWEVFPWDEDKTWGDYDGAASDYDWYSMPLTVGMEGDQPQRTLFGGGPFGGGNWWRPPGHFSGPLLANPEFRRRFLLRVRELCETVFTPQTMDPAINAIGFRLEDEVRLRATLHGESPASAVRDFRRHIDSFRRQVVHRRQWLLKALDAQ